MKILIQVLIICVFSVQNIFSSPIVNYEIKQVADFQISDGAKSFDGITFKDSVNGVALIRNQDYEFYIFRTSNAGDSWEFISEIDIYDRWVMKGIAPPAVTGISCYGDFICITTQPYLALFGPQPPADTGVYMMSYDFGETWEVKNFPEKLSFAQPIFDSSGALFILGSNWNFKKKTATRKGIFKYNKTNDSWEEIPLPTIPDSSNIFDLRVYSNYEYHFSIRHQQIDDDGNSFSIIYNYKTQNSGLTWDLFESPFKNVSVKYTSKNMAWIPSLEITNVNDSTIKQDILLLNTKDEWVSRNKIPIASFLTKVDAPRITFSSFTSYDDDNIWLRYTNIPGNNQYITNNGGKDWVTFPEFDSNIMKMSPTQGYYLNKNTIFLWNFLEGHLLYKFTFDIATSVIERTDELKFKIYPNPVTYGTDFIAEYEIATSGHLKMYLSDLSGREVCHLYSDFVESGSYSTSLRLPENISSGSYWLVSEQNGYKHVQLLNVVK